VDEIPQGNIDSGPPAGSNGRPAATRLPLGRYSGKLDDKGRLKLPTKFQEWIQTLPGDRDLFVTSIDRETVSIYPIEGWQENLDFLAEYRGDDLAVSVALFNSNDLGSEERMDSQGRVLLNSDLRQALKLEDKATLHLTAMKGHIEGITEVVYQQRRVDAEANSATAARKLFGQGLK
jgi:MraZ protein